MAKIKKAKKKYNPASEFKRLVSQTARRIWIADSSCMLKAKVHHPKEVIGTKDRFLRNRVMQEALVAYTSYSSTPWRYWIATFHNDGDGKLWTEAELVEDRPLAPIGDHEAWLAEKMRNTIADAPNHMVGWAWVAVCHEDQNMDAMQEGYIKHFESMGAFDKEHNSTTIEIRKLARATGEKK